MKCVICTHYPKLFMGQFTLSQNVANAQGKSKGQGIALSYHILLKDTGMG